MKKKRKKLYGLLISGPSNPRRRLLARSADAPFSSVPQRRSSVPSSFPTRARAQPRSQGSYLPRVGGSPSAASSDGGAVPGSAAASAAPPPASRQSPRALASVLRAPAGDPAYAPPSPLPPVLYRGSPARAGPWLRRWISPMIPWLIEAVLFSGTLIHWCYYILILTSICLSVKAALKFPMTQTIK
jgi:hypothetical protein